MGKRILTITGGIIVGLILIGIGTAIGHPKTVTVNHTRTVTAQAAPAPTVTVTVTARPAKPKPAGSTMPGDGTFAVGTSAGDWPPGTWKTNGAVGGSAGNCYWATLSDLSGSDNSIIANDDITGPTIITVGPGVAGVQVSGCDSWQEVG